MSERVDPAGQSDQGASALMPAPQRGAQVATRPEERRERMLALIRERQFVRVEELSDRFGISQVTARGDLAALAQQGQIHRIRGGAMPRAVSGQERAFEESETAFAAEKRAIGRAAAALVRDGESLIVDVGTTAVAAAQALVARSELRDIVVFTNGLKTALALEAAIPRFSVVVLGGTLRRLQHSLVDPLAGHILDEISVNTLLLGCNGVHPAEGVTNINLPEGEIKRRMIRVARRRIALADGSKIGSVGLVHLCRVDEIDMVITGASASAQMVDALREHCEVMVAE